VSFLSRSLLWDSIVVSIMAVTVIRLFYRKNPVSSLSDIAPITVGLFYIPGLFSFQVLLRNAGPEWIIFLYASVWVADSLAYYIGRGVGKRRLYEKVSPNKTVAGAVGSVIGGAVGALLLRSIMVRNLSMSDAVLIGIMIGIVSIIGDLVESMFKRDAGVKDSGAIIPGHGGMLDKVDGPLFAGPVLYWVLTVMGIVR
jgi:phosphatidate cytidylyltransferase